MGFKEKIEDIYFKVLAIGLMLMCGMVFGGFSYGIFHLLLGLNLFLTVVLSIITLVVIVWVCCSINIVD
jgi:hypothetical protein